MPVQKFPQLLRFVSFRRRATTRRERRQADIRQATGRSQPTRSRLNVPVESLQSPASACPRKELGPTPCLGHGRALSHMTFCENRIRAAGPMNDAGWGSPRYAIGGVACDDSEPIRYAAYRFLPQLPARPGGEAPPAKWACLRAYLR